MIHVSALFDPETTTNKRIERILAKVRKALPHVVSLGYDEAKNEFVLPNLSAQDTITARAIIQQWVTKTPGDFRQEEAKEFLAAQHAPALASRAAYRAVFQALLKVVQKLNEVIEKTNASGDTILTIIPRDWEQIEAGVKADI